MTSTRMKRPLKLAPPLVAISIAISGCVGGSSTNDNSEAATSVTIAVADATTSWAIDQSFASFRDPNWNVHATLLRKVNEPIPGQEEHGSQNVLFEYQPNLASYEVSEDGLVYTFTMEDDVVSAAGNPLNADDVMYSFERKLNTPTSITIGAMAPAITSMDQFAKLDDMTFTMTFDKPSYGSLALTLLSDFPGQIYDKELLEEHATDTDPYAVEWSAGNPNHGFGPYVVDQYQPGQEIRLTARDDYHGGELEIETISIQTVANPGTRSQTLLSGDVDIAQGLLPADQANMIDNDSVYMPKPTMTNLSLYAPLVTTKAPFDDVEVRRAFAYAVDYDSILETVYHGLAERNGQTLLTAQPEGFDNDAIEMYNYDPEHAKQILADAGYTENVPFTLTIPEDEADSNEAAVVLQSSAREAGFDIELQALPNSAYQEGSANHTFQAMIEHGNLIIASPYWQLKAFFQEGNSQQKPDFTWYQPYQDVLQAGIDAGPEDSPEAVAKWQEAAEIWVDQNPVNVIVTDLPVSAAFTSELGGYVWAMDNTLDYAALEFVN